MRIGGFVDMSTVDWYGNVSLVVFFAGCNFRCPYCMNSGLLPIESGKEMNLDTIRKRILVNMSPVPQLDAVVFSGGEPLLQPEGLMEASRLVKSLGLKLMLDTNGSIPAALEPLLDAGLLDRVALDIKAPLRLEDYQKVAGLSNDAARLVEGVKRTLALCFDSGIEIEARTTVAPTFSDDAEFIRRIARDIRNHCDVYYLQQFDNTGNVLSPELKVKQPPTRAVMLKLGRAALEEGIEDVYIKTREHGLEKVS